LLSRSFCTWDFGFLPTDSEHPRFALLLLRECRYHSMSRDEPARPKTPSIGVPRAPMRHSLFTLSTVGRAAQYTATVELHFMFGFSVVLSASGSYHIGCHDSQSDA
jgi:hypothetical protein